MATYKLLLCFMRVVKGDKKTLLLGFAVRHRF